MYCVDLKVILGKVWALERRQPKTSEETLRFALRFASLHLLYNCANTQSRSLFTIVKINELIIYEISIINFLGRLYF